MCVNIYIKYVYLSPIPLLLQTWPWNYWLFSMHLIANLGSGWSFCLVKPWVLHLLVCSLTMAWNHRPALEWEVLAGSLVLQPDSAVLCYQDIWHTWYRGVGFPWESAGPADSVGFVLCFVNVLLICSDIPSPPFPLNSWQFGNPEYPAASPALTGRLSWRKNMSYCKCHE